MAYFALILISFFSLSANASTVFDMGEHSGIIRDSNGNFSKVSANGSIRTLTSNTALALVEKPIIQTSKGALEVSLNRTVPVDVPRIGKAIGAFAQKVGPLSMALATVDLICSLSNICNQSGSWIAGGVDPNPSLPNSYPVSDGQWWGWNSNYYPDVQSACSDTARLTVNVGSGAQFDHYEVIDSSTYRCYGKLPQYPGNVYFASNTNKITGCAPQYTLNGSTCQKSGVTTSHPATANDWTAKESLLNNSGFTPELFNAGESIPTGTPVLTGSPVNVPMGTTTKTLKDGSGTVTGTESAVTSLSITDGATSTAPNVINITETMINTTYNTSNVVTGSMTTTTDPVQPLRPSKTDPLEIKFDTVNDTPLTEKIVTAPFTTTSWGSGECPPDIAMNLTRGNYSIDSQPFCDFAISLKPVLLLVAALAGAYIVITSTRPTAS
ncbi:virulence factor TspB C-terminal domain-related protein [Nitrosomonas sp.]|uniref:virulence factor TspB C-terminal domain-related protein n=1 Tax=Nitrosomonas sp. TaxID=42353 RepID=UPI0025FEFB7C|nr:virulence factor TspB C-terminal domain-related protein [Nitrosomonas sp.]